MADVRRLLPVAVVLLVASTATVTTAVTMAAPAVDCVMLHVQAGRNHAASTLLRVELPSGAAGSLGKLGYHVNAIGYARDQDLVYGIGSRGRSHAHLVTISRRGTVADLGAVRRLSGGFADPTAGAISGRRLFVRDHRRLYTIDIDPRSASYRSVVRAVWLSPASLADSVHDFDVGRDGLLYGVATPAPGLLGFLFGRGPARVVSIDPVRGKVRIVSTPGGLPRYPSYSSVVLGSPGTMYAVHTGGGDRSRLFRIRLDGSGAVTELASLSAASASDAAGCLGPTTRPPTSRPPSSRPPTSRPPTSRPPSSRPPSSRPPSSRPPTTRPPLPPPSPPPATPVPPEESLPPSAPPSSPSTPAPSSPAPSTPARTTPPASTPVPTPGGTPATGRFSPPPGTAAMSPEADRTVTVLRRWSLATLLLVLTAGAVGALHAQGRGRR